MKQMVKKYICFTLIVLLNLSCMNLCFTNISAETSENVATITSDSEKNSGVNKKIVYSTTKSIITTGDKPSTLTTNCKDAVEQYWSKTTTISGGGNIDSGFNGFTSGTTSFMPGDENTVTTLAGTFPKYRQGNPEVWSSWKYYSDTLAMQACGPTSLAIILAGLGLVIPGYDGISLHGNSSPEDGIMTPPEVCAYSLAVGGHTSSGAMTWSFPNVIMSNFGIEVITYGSGSAEEVLNLLKQGYCGIASTSTGFFTSGGHIIAVVGANSDDGGNTIGIVDPANSIRDGFYTVDQLNGNAEMPAEKGKNGKTNANIVKWWIFKYQNPNANSSQSGSVNLSARTKPSSKDAIDKVLDSMNDLEIMARLIKGEQSGNSFETQVLVGISILNRGSDIKAIAKNKSGNTYSYNCIEGELFWQAIPQECVNAANKAIQAKKSGTYKVIDVKSNTSVEAINVEGFKGKENISEFDDKWYNWSLIAVLKNKVGHRYTGYYGYK